ncbi:hypothetical protein D3C76_1640420 [compost metagenome]
MIRANRSSARTCLSVMSSSTRSFLLMTPLMLSSGAATSSRRWRSILACLRKLLRKARASSPRSSRPWALAMGSTRGTV